MTINNKKLHIWKSWTF